MIVLTNSFSFSSHISPSFVQDINYLYQTIGTSFCYISRNLNKTTHVLANLARTRSSSFSWVCDIPTNFCIDPDIYFDSLAMVWFCLPLKKVNKLSTKSNLGEDLANSVFWNFVMSLTFLKWKMLISLIRKKAIHWGFYFCSKIIIQNPKHFNYSNRN